MQLAYLIKKQKEADYLKINVVIAPKLIKELAKKLNLDLEILRHTILNNKN